MKELFNDKKKRNLILGICLSLMLMIMGTTYAYFTWQSSKNPVVNITVEDLGDVLFRGGNEIKSTNIGPVLDYNDGEITEFYLQKKIDDTLDVSVNIIPTLLPDTLKDESFKVKLLSSTDNVTYTEVAEGNFKDKEANVNFTLTTTELTNTLTYFRVVFYIDGHMVNSNNMKEQSFEAKIDISVDSQCPKNTVTPVYTDTSSANAPVLAEGMIPVVYDEGLGLWLKADTDAGWYNYTDKIWANAVMVKANATEGAECSKSRNEYINASAFTPILEEDILAYYVWIPRYKYKLFNVTYDTGTSASLIDVVFENGTNSTGTTKCSVSEIGVETCTNKENGNYYTHPAFTFGEEELKGIWVGKFETTGKVATPTVKPNMTSLVGHDVSMQFTASQKFNSTTYLTSNGVNVVDSHMMKNIEWGAVAYLKQSNYGLGITDIGINNNKSKLTGCGAAAGSSSSSTCNAYNTETGMLASTTGNVTGVYDMSGGTHEHMMGVMQDNTTSRSPMSGSRTSSNSGYVGKVYQRDSTTKLYNYIDSGKTLAFPDSKYYDLYANGTSFDDITRSHLGDATGETAGWYSDNVSFVCYTSPWFGRFGTYGHEDEAGVFSFTTNGGCADAGFGFRITLAVTE